MCVFECPVCKKWCSTVSVITSHCEKCDCASVIEGSVYLKYYSLVWKYDMLLSDVITPPFLSVDQGVSWRLPESWKDLLLHTKDHQTQEGNLSFAKPSKNVHRGNYSETSSFSDWILAVFTLSRARCRNPPDGIKCSASDCVSPEENVLNQLSSLLNLMIWRNYDFKACWHGFETWLKEHFSKLH